MKVMPAALNIVVTNDLSELERVSRELEDFGRGLGMSAADLSTINLAVDEILTNIILYAFPDSAGHEIGLRAHLDGNTLALRIEDGGRAFDPTGVAEPKLDETLEDRPVGGLGIHIVRRLVDEMTYDRDGDRNVLTLKKRLTAAEPVVAAPPRDKIASIAESEDRGVVVFSIAGRLDAHGVATLEDRIRVRLESGARRFLFDCGGLDSLSSAGLRVLLIAAKEAAAAGGGVALASPREGISQTIAIAGLSDLLPTFENREEALAFVLVA